MRLTLTLSTVLLVAGCATSPSLVPISTEPAAPTPAPTLSATTAASSPEASRHAALVVCRMGERCDAEPGTFVTDAEGFFPGLEITMPAGWFFTEQDAGELALHPDDDPDKTGGARQGRACHREHPRAGPYNEIVEDVAPTPKPWWIGSRTTRPSPSWRSPRKPRLRGPRGPPSPSRSREAANHGDAECPSNPRCAGSVLTIQPTGVTTTSASAGQRRSACTWRTSRPDPGTHLFAVVGTGGPRASSTPGWNGRMPF